MCMYVVAELNFIDIDPPPSPSSATCSLIRTTRGPEVSIQWFTSQYDVEMYHLVVNPATPSCSSDQMIVSQCVIIRHLHKV